MPSLFPILPSLLLALFGEKTLPFGLQVYLLSIRPIPIKQVSDISNSHLKISCYTTMLNSKITLAGRVLVLPLSLSLCWPSELGHVQFPGYPLLLAPCPSHPAQTLLVISIVASLALYILHPLFYAIINLPDLTQMSLTIFLSLPQCSIHYLLMYSHSSFFSFKLSFSGYLLCTRHYSRTWGIRMNQKWP